MDIREAIKLLQKFRRKLVNLFRLYIRRDPLLVNAKRWFSDRGDVLLRLEYPLNQSSIVIDVGGYLGDFAQDIYNKYGCRVYLFEPVAEFYQECVKRFEGNSSILCFNYGLSATSRFLDIALEDNASSFENVRAGIKTQVAQLRTVTEVLEELGLENIDLIKINIEGGEFELLPALIESGFIKNIRYLQVQFHDFIKDAADKRLQIRQLLDKTHREMWNYDFVWESWELR